jgi:putative MATE family efflux protein
MEIESSRPAAASERQGMLATEPVKSLLWRLSLPAMAGMFTMSLYHVVDTIFIGRGVGPLAIAGVTIVFPVMMLMMALGMMFGIGAASVVSRRLGAGMIRNAEEALGTAFALVVCSGLVFTVVGLPASEGLMRLFGASDAVLQYSLEYVQVVLLFAAFGMYPMALNNLARAEGNARIAMTTMILGATLNLVLDPIFIFGLHLGVRGAAIATVISQMVTSVYITSYFLSGRSTLRLRRPYIRIRSSVAREVLAIGFPSFVRMGAASVIVLVINRTLVLHGGDMSVAAYGIVNRSMMFLAMPLMGIAQGLQPVLGFAWGARRFDRARDVTAYALGVASVLSLAGFVVLYFMPGPIMGLFTTDASLIQEGIHASRRVFLVFFLVGFQIVGSTVFQSLGMVAKTFIASTSRQVLFLIPLVLVLPRYLGADGVWLAIPIADALSFGLVLAMVIPQLREFGRRYTEQTVEVTDGAGA